MINKLLLTITAFLSLVLVSQPKNTIPVSEEIKTETKTIDVKDSTTGSIENKDLEDYVVGVVAAEMPASFDDEALKAQSVASRTYAYYKMTHSNGDYDVISDISDQAYITIDQMKEKWGSEFDEYYNKIVENVKTTEGEIMTYNGEVIKAFYFAMSNGYTENVQTVFKEDFPYLKSVESRWDNEKLNKYKVTTTFDKQDFCNKLGISCDSINITKQTYDKTGRTNEITINSKTFKGTEFRKLLTLRSADFKIKVNDNTVEITTKGYGHGVGMSQYGANGMAQDGFNYHDILKHYYQDIEFSKL